MSPNAEHAQSSDNRWFFEGQTQHMHHRYTTVPQSPGMRITNSTIPAEKTHLDAMCCTHLSSALLALPWNLPTIFLFMGGLAISELALLSTDEVLLDSDLMVGRLLVSSSICRKQSE